MIKLATMILMPVIREKQKENNFGSCLRISTENQMIKKYTVNWDKCQISQQIYVID